MPARPIVLYPDPILKKLCRPADPASPETRAAVQDLIDTLAEVPGVGVAAPQIGVDLRIFAMDVTPRHPGHGRLVLLNPMVTATEGRTEGREGCLSIPDYTANVRRHARCQVQALNSDGESVQLELEGFEAICFQHELDHLDGMLFLDRVSCLKTDVFRRKGATPRFVAQEYPRETPTS